MIRLGKPGTEPEWIGLPGFDVELKVKPLTTTVYRIARAKAERRALDLAASYGAVVQAGGEIDGLPDLLDSEEFSGLVDAELTVALAEVAIVEWREVFTEDGETPAPVTPETVRQLIECYPMGERFHDVYMARQVQVMLEKKDSGHSPSGTSAQGPNTAAGAGTKGSDAVADSGVAAVGGVPT